MWSWLIIILIALCCLFCFFSVVQLELKRPNAKVWVVLTCLSIFTVIGILLNVPSPVTKKYSYELKPAKIELKYLNTDEEFDQLTESTTGTEIEKITNEEKRVFVIVSKLNIRSDPQEDAQIIGSVQYGQILNITEDSEDLDWVKVKTDDGSTGWVVKRYLNYFNE